MDEGAGGQGVAGGGIPVVACEGLPNRMGDFRNFRNFRYRFCRGPLGESAGFGNDATRYCAREPLDDREFLRTVIGVRKSGRQDNWAICAIPATLRRLWHGPETTCRRPLAAHFPAVMIGHVAELPGARAGRHRPQYCSGTSSGFTAWRAQDNSCPPHRGLGIQQHAVHASAQPTTASPEVLRAMFNSEQVATRCV
jgi:hypothetical protein